MHTGETELLETTLGDLVAAFYDSFFEEYRDSEIAAVATSAVLQERFADAHWEGDPLTLAA